MLHLIGPGGTPVVVGDGLGVPLESWQVGDVLVQRHRLTLPQDAPIGDYTLYTGAYWLDTLEREYLKKYHGSDYEDFQEKAKRMRFLQYRGFSIDQINKVIN